MLLLRNTQRVMEQRQYLTKQGTPINEVMYNPATWAEWTNRVSVVSDSTGLEFTYSNTVVPSTRIITAVKSNTKYGVIINIVSNTLVDKLLQVIGSNYGIVDFNLAVGGAIGNRKVLFNTATITTNIFQLSRGGGSGEEGNKIKLRDIRIYELPTGSQIEADFTNLTADQLNLKYPYAGYALLDRSRFANNGVFSNVTWVQLPTGVWVMNFDGVNSYVEIPDSPTMRMAQGGSILAWVYARTIGKGGYGGRIIDKGIDLASTNGYVFSIGAINSLSSRINSGSTTLTVSNAFPFYTWKFAVATFSPTGRKIIVNGVDVTASGGAETALPPNVAGNVRIGNRAGETDRTFDGYIGGVRLLSKVLTVQEVARIYNSEKWMYGV